MPRCAKPWDRTWPIEVPAVGNIFSYLLGIERVPELRLALLILARAGGDGWTKISDQEMASLTGLAKTALDQCVKEMLTRNLVLRRRTREGFEYRVPFCALGISEDVFPPKPAPDPLMAALEPYFARTGFLDLMPEAVKMARVMHYGQEEMVEAICKVADKLKTNPPTRNRKSWFATVYKEKLREARAELTAFRARKHG